MPRQAPIITKRQLQKMVLIQHQTIRDLRADRAKLIAQVTQLEDALHRTANGERSSRIPWYRKILNFIGGNI